MWALGESLWHMLCASLLALCPANSQIPGAEQGAAKPLLSHCSGLLGAGPAALLPKRGPWKRCLFVPYTKPVCPQGHLGSVLSSLITSPCLPPPSFQSRMVRNETPYLIWTTRRDVLDCRFLAKDQMINHYARAGSFTTKVGSQTWVGQRTPQPWAPSLQGNPWESKNVTL